MKQCKTCDNELWEDLLSNKKNYITILGKDYCKDCFKDFAPFYKKK